MIVLTLLLTGFKNVRIKGWLKLSSEQTKECMSKLQYETLNPSSTLMRLANDASDLMHKSDEDAQSMQKMQPKRRLD